jgi:hypothetical protein
VVVGPDTEDPVRKALTLALGPTGFPAPAEIPARHRAPIAKASTEGSLDELPRIADALSGAVDVVVRIAYDCEFAGRMGGNRVWFEAVATLTVYDAWTGRVLEHDEVRAKANGVGDDRADAAARKQLAQRLAERIARED